MPEFAKLSMSAVAHVVALSAAVEYPCLHTRVLKVCLLWPVLAGWEFRPTVTPLLLGALFEPLVAAHCTLRCSDDMCLRLLLATALAARPSWVELKLRDVSKEDLQ
jgi:hypothetical protein